MIERITVVMNERVQGGAEDRRRILAMHGDGKKISGMDEHGYHVHCLLNPNAVEMVELLIDALNTPSILSISYERSRGILS